LSIRQARAKPDGSQRDKHDGIYELFFARNPAQIIRNRKAVSSIRGIGSLIYTPIGQARIAKQAIYRSTNRAFRETSVSITVSVSGRTSHSQSRSSLS